MSNNFHLKSQDVIVFPLSKARPTPGAGMPGADGSVVGVDLNRTRLLTEKTVSNIVYQLIDTDGFIISCTEDTTENKFGIEFNLAGYYFNVVINMSLSDDGEPAHYSDWTDIFATITISDSYSEIVGQDVGGKYTGLVLSDSASETPGDYSLKILTRDTKTDTWSVPKDCYRKFTPQSLGISGIDGRYENK